MKRYTLLLTAVFVLVALMVPLRGGFTDDGFIHVQYARNIVTRGEYSFNPGAVSFGTTSPLWVMMLAALGRVFGSGEVLITISRVLSWLAGIGAVLLMYRLGRALQLTPVLAGLCCIALAGHAWHVRWTALSMETSSAVLAMVAVGAASAGAPGDPRRSAWLGLFMALVSLIRPEAYLLLPVYLAAVVLSRRRSASCVARTLVVYVLLVLPWLLFAKFHIGRFLPNTAGAKSGGLVLDPLLFVSKLRPIAEIVGSAEGVFGILILLSLVMLRGRAQVLSGRCRFLLLWVLALPLAYVLFDIQVLSRYMLLTSPFVIVLGLVALQDMCEVYRVRRVVPLAAGITVAAVAMNVILYLVVVLPPSKAFSQDLTHRLKALGVFLKDNSSEGAVVAAADIGYLAFYSERHVLDLGGLVETVTHALREEYDYEEIVDRGLYLELESYPRVDFFIDRVKEPNRFNGEILAGYRFESIRVVEIRNLGIRKPGPFYYTLYRLHPVTDA